MTTAWRVAALLLGALATLGAVIPVVLLLSDLSGDRTAPGLSEALNNLLTGDLGFSDSHNAPVLALILNHGGVTLSLIALALLYIGLLGGGLTLIESRFGGTNWAARVQEGAWGLTVIPGFAWALIFSLCLKFLSHGSDIQRLPGQPLPLWLAALALALPVSACLARGLGPALRTAMVSDYAMLARTWGYSESQLFYRAALRPAIVADLKRDPQRLPRLVTGTVLVEAVSGIPGLGTLTVAAIGARDAALMPWAILAVVALIALARLIAATLRAFLERPGSNG